MQPPSRDERRRDEKTASPGELLQLPSTTGFTPVSVADVTTVFRDLQKCSFAFYARSSQVSGDCYLRDLGTRRTQTHPRLLERFAIGADKKSPPLALRSGLSCNYS